VIGPLFTPERRAQRERKEAESEQRSRDMVARIRELAASGLPVHRRWQPYTSRSNGRLMTAADLGVDE